MKIRIKFRKQGAMKFIGHLDIMRYFQKAMRRAEVDIRYSEGFSPHQIMSFAAPLGVGILSNGEYLDIEVLSTGSSAEMTDRLNRVMSEGMEILSYKRLDDAAPSAMSLVAAADYTVWFRPGKEPEDPEAFFAAMERFYARESIPILKKTKKGEREIDLRPLIYRLERRRKPAEGSLCQGPETEAPGCGDAVFMQISAGSADHIKPELVMEALCQYAGLELPPFAFQVQREEVYADLDPGAGEERTGADSAGGRRLVPLEALGEDIE